MRIIGADKAIAGLVGRLPFRRFTRPKLLIICYHGFAMDDEWQFNPSMFMKVETFAERVSFLAENRWPVLPLGEALQRLAANDLPPGAVVLTADDGWIGTVRIAGSILSPHMFSLTNYVTTHYVERKLPVSNVLLSYILWKGRGELSSHRELRISGHTFQVDPRNIQNLRQSLTAASERLDAPGRETFNRHLANSLHIDYDNIRDKQLFRLMDEAELSQAADAGIDLQLHGHRHLGGRTVDDERLFKSELIVNREKLAPFTTSSLEHYCYPSGVYGNKQEQWLRELGVTSACTCEPGLNGPGANPFQLRRFLDRENISLARFALEVSGLRERVRHR